MATWITKMVSGFSIPKMVTIKVIHALLGKMIYQVSIQMVRLKAWQGGSTQELFNSKMKYD